MFNSLNQDLNNIGLKQSSRLNNQLKLLAQNKDTSYLISIKNLENGSFLAEENKAVNGIYFILKGKVKVFNTEMNQKTKIFRLASSGDIVGFSSLNSVNYWSSAIAIENVEAYFINLKSLRYILKNNSKLSFLFINALALKLHHYEMRQRYLNLFPAQERVIEILLLTANKFGNANRYGIEITDCISRKEIASFANTSTENAIRSHRSLNSKNYISIVGKKIIIKNKEALINQLKQYCCANNLKVGVHTCYLDLFY
ncbi:MAG: Crp/Fnr family transcriptional regulator [Flavobacteriaceae bacterium]|nr:Crp/Fnr family transcriptional regulator [Flavobacteriaceae bacterium]